MSTLFWKAFSLLFLSLPIPAFCFEALRTSQGIHTSALCLLLSWALQTLAFFSSVTSCRHCWGLPYYFKAALDLSTWEPLVSPSYHADFACFDLFPHCLCPCCLLCGI